MFKIILKLKILENCTIRPETIRNDRNADNLEHIMRKKQMLCQKKKKKKCLLEEYEFFEVAQIFGFAFSKMLLNHMLKLLKCCIMNLFIICRHHSKVF